MNKLTEKLLAEGYTKDNHPDYVMPGRGFKDGDFEYYYWYSAELVYKTPCGMQVLGKNTHSGMSWYGKEYCHENEEVTIRCPKNCVNCQQRGEPFNSEGDGIMQLVCPVKLVNEKYVYDGSVEAEQKLLDDQIKRDKISFMMEKQGRVCEHHMRHDPVKGWIFRYNPWTCVNGYCNNKRNCPVLGRDLGTATGNIYYDIDCEGRDYTLDGTFFEGERFHTLHKGFQVFKKPVNLELAKIYAKLCEDEIKYHALINCRLYDSLTMFRAERGEIDLTLTVVNIRVEKKLARDFDQDLSDIEAGIKVTHVIDETRKKKQEKHERLETAKEKRKKSMYKKIVKDGWKSLEEMEKQRAYKLLSPEEISVAIKESEIIKPEQMTMFDFI